MGQLKSNTEKTGDTASEQIYVSVTTYRLCLVLGLVTIQETLASNGKTVHLKPFCSALINAGMSDPSVEKLASQIDADGKSKKCAENCVTKFNVEEFGQCEPTTMNDCAKCALKCVREAAIRDNPKAKCRFDCIDQFNPDLDQQKCHVPSGDCFKCLSECKSGTKGEEKSETKSGSGRNLAGTVVVTSLFFALMW